jgi:hypothetical protein
MQQESEAAKLGNDTHIVRPIPVRARDRSQFHIGCNFSARGV